jgi:hypothetical protein
MVQHIYGNNVLSSGQRPNMLINELKLYVDYLKKDISDFTEKIGNSQIKSGKHLKKIFLLELLTMRSFFRG